MAVQDGLIEHIFYQHRLAETVRADQNDIGSLLDEGEREDLLDERTITLGGPLPVEVGDGLEDPDARVVETPLEAASRALGLLDVEQLGQPGFGDEGLGG